MKSHLMRKNISLKKDVSSGLANFYEEGFSMKKYKENSALLIIFFIIII